MVRIPIRQKRQKYEARLHLGVVVGGGGEGFTPLYKPYRYVPPQKVGFLRHFGLKTGIDFAHFDLEFGIVYVRTTIVYQCVRRFNS